MREMDGIAQSPCKFFKSFRKIFGVKVSKDDSLFSIYEILLSRKGAIKYDICLTDSY